FTNAGWSWMNQVAALVFAGYSVILPDLRGHGLSDPAADVTTVDDLTRDVIGLLDHLAIARVSVCGLSLGGMIALTLALEQPQRVDRLVVANSRAAFNDPATADLVAGWVEIFHQPGGPLRRFQATWPVMLNAQYRESSAGRATYATWCRLAERHVGSSLANVALGMRAFDVAGRLQGIGNPALVIAGEEDKLFPPAVAREVSDGMADAQFMIIPGAAHISSLDSAETFNAGLLAFLAG
ncbi:alpha/beta fold hydrolase, partial [Methylobacterium sp. E-065]|uniref:alpha/beta fold hydrolase n=1 Tax=Methylobacterium sp. E-065 TaxID=2836583 RepID=UPI001FB913F5